MITKFKIKDIINSCDDVAQSELIESVNIGAELLREKKKFNELIEECAFGYSLVRQILPNIYLGRMQRSEKVWWYKAFEITETSVAGEYNCYTHANPCYSEAHALIAGIGLKYETTDHTDSAVKLLLLHSRKAR